MRRPRPNADRPRGQRGPVRKPRGALLGVTLSVPAVPHWLRSLSERPGLSSRLLACHPLPPSARQSVHLLELAGGENEVRSAITSIERSPSRTVSVSPGPRDRVLLRVIARTGGPCRALFLSGGICRTCRFRSPRRPEGHVDWEVLTTRPSGAFLGVGPRSPRGVRGGTLRSLGGPVPYSRLTGRQEEALRCADRLGYFSVPRKAGLTALAGALGISRSAAAELLRRGLHVLVQAMDSPRLSGSPGSPREAR